MNKHKRIKKLARSRKRFVWNLLQQINTQGE